MLALPYLVQCKCDELLCRPASLVRAGLDLAVAHVEELDGGETLQQQHIMQDSSMVAQQHGATAAAAVHKQALLQSGMFIKGCFVCAHNVVGSLK